MLRRSWRARAPPPPLFAPHREAAMVAKNGRAEGGTWCIIFLFPCCSPYVLDGHRRQPFNVSGPSEARGGSTLRPCDTATPP